MVQAAAQASTRPLPFFVVAAISPWRPAHSGHRRRGLARRVLTVLEREAADRGYSRL